YPGEFRIGTDGKIIFRKTAEEGQWGVSSDEYGRLYRNSNEDPLRADLIPSHYSVRNPNAPNPRGVYERLTANIPVWPAHKTPAVNRGYRAETMRPDSTLAHYTSAGAPTAYVGNRLPAELKSSVFITESAGNMVGRLIVHDSADGIPVARTAYDHKEFLTATDERFRPVNLANAPDGTLYMVDMYRGIIQHRFFITGYLEQKIIERGLDQGIGMGRIWRIVHTSTTRDSVPQLSKRTPSALVPYLADANGWRRMTAQRLLVERGDTSVAATLRSMARTNTDDKARLHALWTLDGLHVADRATIEAALADASAPVRAAAVRIAEPMLVSGDTAIYASVMRLLADRSPTVRRQVAASVGELPSASRDDALVEVIAQSGDDPVVADLVVSALPGRELAFLDRLVATKPLAEARSAPTLRALARAVVTSRDVASVQHVLTLAGDATRSRWERLALLEGARRPTEQRGGFVVELTEKPTALLAAMAGKDAALRTQATLVASSLNWPGKKATTPPVKPFTPAERARYATGQQQFLTTCAGCHQVRGTGLTGVAKPLVGSPWVLGAPDRLIRIVLHGKEGTMLMPPVGANMSNDQIAAILTYIRRSWGNSATAVDAALVSEVRGLTTGRNKPWTEEELQRA
ncbi:MAG: c-type cytochrome, partial [bacterium]